ncbi:MAG: RNA methyltransferase [Planctomycetes bacterium]|nr:RNA methyltransferase [Planctomycetota bacterium]MCP4771419.1 RNA methyltransferase [Planctomycetota bacterium]MCP4861856.1 RNA methyltransferase [Planctomycetota bacterium]
MNLDEPIRSAQNAKLKAVRAMRAGKERGSTVLEGRHLLEEALDNDVAVAWVLISERLVSAAANPATTNADVAETTSAVADAAVTDHANPSDYSTLIQRAQSAGIEVAVCQESLLADVSRFEGAPDLLAWASRPLGDWREALAQSQPGDWWMVAGGVQDPGNLGALVRVAAGFGAAGVLCLKGGGSPWHPRALRGAAGTTFRLPVFERIEIKEFLAAATEFAVELWATAADGESVDPNAAASRTEIVALMMGEEGRGLSAELFDACSKRVGIPLDRGVESLNVATAAAVIAAAMRVPKEPS